MRPHPTDVIERGRIRDGVMGSDRTFGTTGAFHVVMPHRNTRLSIIASNDAGWEHVSVRVYKPKPRTPTWDEMSWVKDQFWPGTEAVMQLHVPASDHVNNSQHCLHLWRPTDRSIPRPPAWMVGSKDAGVLS